MKYLYLVYGKSGTGKSTIIDKYCIKYGCNQLLSYTTRPMREEEIDNPTHIHITEQEFDVISDDLVAYTMFDKYRYGATKQQCNEVNFYVIDPSGINYFKKKFPEKLVKVIQIESDAKVRYNRMVKRDGRIKAYMRLQNDAKIDFDYPYDYKLVNDESKTIEELVEELHKFIIYSEERGNSYEDGNRDKENTCTE